MNVQFGIGVEGTKSCIYFESDEYDGYLPLKKIYFNNRLRTFDPNVAAVCAAIAVERYISERVTFEMPIQVHVADAIVEYFNTKTLKIHPVELKPLAIPEGQRTVYIGQKIECPESMVYFDIGDSNSFKSYIDLNEIKISTNINYLFDDNNKGSLITLICGVVFCSVDYSIRKIVIGNYFKNVFNPEDVRRLSDILGSININIEMESQCE